jgi:hypothetical protein
MDNNINEFEKILNIFWEEDIWEINYQNINNNKIKNIIKSVQTLKKNIDNFDIITNIKETNINYLKTHSDCIPEYHYLIIEYKKKIINK